MYASTISELQHELAIDKCNYLVITAELSFSVDTEKSQVATDWKDWDDTPTVIAWITLYFSRGFLGVFEQSAQVMLAPKEYERVKVYTDEHRSSCKAVLAWTPSSLQIDSLKLENNAKWHDVYHS